MESSNGQGFLSRLSGPPKPRTPFATYLVAFLVVAAAFAVSIATSGAHRAPLFPFFTLAILISTLYGGKKAGWFAVLLSLCTSVYLLIPRLGNWLDGVRLGAFALVGVSVVVLVDRLRSTAQSLEKQREWLHVTLHSIGDAVIATDAQGRISFMNPVAETLTGWTIADASGHVLTDVFRIKNESTGETSEDPVAKVIRSGTVVGLANHTVLTRKDGSELFIDDSAAPIRGQTRELTGVVLIFRDISEQRQLEREREAAHRQTEKTLASINEGFFALDADWRFVYVNDQAVAQTGKTSKSEFIGKTLYEVFPAAVGSKFDAAYKEAIAEQKTVRLREFYPPLGAWFQVSAYPSADGSFTVFFQDVSAQVKAEEALRVADKLSATGRLAATISHEINNPLGAVTNLVFLAKSATSLEQCSELLTVAERELARVARITHETLGFVRSNHITTPAARLTAMLNEIVAFQVERIAQRGVTIEKQYAPEAENATVAGEMRQVFSNLISNALDFVGKGGVIKVFVEPSCNAEPQGFTVTVEDNGVGIPRDHLERVFEPFFTTKENLGTGLGLWVSKGLVEKHGGSIVVDSNTDDQARGTRFSVFIPAVAAQNATGKAAGAAS